MKKNAVLFSLFLFTLIIFGSSFKKPRGSAGKFIVIYGYAIKQTCDGKTPTQYGFKYARTTEDKYQEGMKQMEALLKKENSEATSLFVGSSYFEYGPGAQFMHALQYKLPGNGCKGNYYYVGWGKTYEEAKLKAMTRIKNSGATDYSTAEEYYWQL